MLNTIILERTCTHDEINGKADARPGQFAHWVRQTVKTLPTARRFSIVQLLFLAPP